MDSTTTAAAAPSPSGGNSQDVPSDTEVSLLSLPILYHEKKKAYSRMRSYLRT